MDRRRVVIKIGSSSLTDTTTGLLNRGAVDRYVEMIARLASRNVEVVLVTSGAVASGFQALGLKTKPKNVRSKQAAAAIGQGRLMHAYSEAFAAYNKVVAQVLLTRLELSVKEAFDNAFNTLEELMNHGVIPIINENDSIATDELRFGDNDLLSAYVAALVRADTLAIITDVDGLYDTDPRSNPEAKRMTNLEGVTNEWLERASNSGSKVGTGGMRAKLIAARQANAFGVRVFIGRADQPEALSEVIEGKGSGTFIGAAVGVPIAKRKQWIGLHGEVHGHILVDAGAAEALATLNKSLLPVGVISVEGYFQEGSIVSIRNAVTGEMIGRGVTRWSSEDFTAYRSDVNSSSSRERSIEMVHRDDWVPSATGEGENQ